MQVALHHVLLAHNHVVPQIVKHKLVVCAVSDIARVSLTTFVVVQTIQNTTHRHAKKAEHFTHPLRVALCQIVIDRDNVHALAFQRVQISRQRCYQRFAFTCFHFRDAPLVHHDAAHQLYREMTHVQHIRSRRSLPHNGVCFWQNVVQRFSRRQTVPEFLCFSSQFLIGKGFILGSQRLDLTDDRFDFLNLLFAVIPKYLFQ